MSLATAGKATGGFSSWLLDQGEVDPLAPYQNSSLSILLAYSEGADFVVEPADALPFPALVEDGGELYRARAVNGGGTAWAPSTASFATAQPVDPTVVNRSADRIRGAPFRPNVLA